MYVRGIRGAITAEDNTEEAIFVATTELLQRVIGANELVTEDISSIIFTVTGDLDAAFPAAAARKLGLVHVPLVCTQEIPVPQSLQRCIRLLMHVMTDKKQDEIVHIYLKGARCLRPDLV
ncbi:MAG: chorismate mutase [Limnochordia bacterium]|nr:chorismate mutase [Limnochordia bacterium]